MAWCLRGDLYGTDGCVCSGESVEEDPPAADRSRDRPSFLSPRDGTWWITVMQFYTTHRESICPSHEFKVLHLLYWVELKWKGAHCSQFSWTAFRIVAQQRACHAVVCERLKIMHVLVDGCSKPEQFLHSSDTHAAFIWSRLSTALLWLLCLLD